MSDGRLTVSNGPNAHNNKLCFIDITAVSAPAAMVSIAEPFTLSWVGLTSDGQVKLQVNGTSASSCVIEASSDLITWERLTVAPIVNKTVTFDGGNVLLSQQRFYRARLEPYIRDERRRDLQAAVIRSEAAPLNPGAGMCL